MKNRYTTLLPLLMILLLTGCQGFSIKGSGVVKDETRQIENFTSLEASGAYNIEIICGSEPSLQIIGDDNIVPLIKTEVSGNNLYISSSNSISARRRIKIRITVPVLNEIISEGANDFRVSGIKTEKFRLHAGGAGSIVLSGRAQWAEYSVSGAVGVDARTLKSTRVNVELSGAAKASVFASEELIAEISGAGNIDYYGNPGIVKRRISGLGSLTQM